MSASGLPLGSYTYVRVTGCPDQELARDGTFDVSCATSTYDVAVTYSTDAIVYQGLTRRDPVLTYPGLLMWDDRITVSGTIVGATPGRSAGVAITPGWWNRGLSDALADGAFSRDAYRFDNDDPSVSVHALEWTETPGGTSSFTGYGAAAATLTHGVNPTVSPVLAPIATGWITASTVAALPATRAVLAEWPDGALTQVGQLWPWSRAADVPTPDIPGVTFTFVATQDGNPMVGAWRRGLPATAAIDPFGLPTAAAFTAPSPGAVVNRNTEFAFEGTAGAVYLVAFEATTPHGPWLYVVTRATSARMPDLSWARYPPPEAIGTLNVSVNAFGPLGSVDEAAAEPLTQFPAGGLWASPIPPSGFGTRHTVQVQATR